MTYRYAVFARFADESQARSLLDELPQSKLAHVKAREFACRTADCAEGIVAGLMNNSTWAESDGRRGLRIGLVLGAVLGPALGYLLFHLLELPTGIGLLIGGMMGTMTGALMSGIIGAGLVHPNLKQITERLEPGQVLLSISCRSRDEHRRAAKHLAGTCIESVESP
ncbi:MAG: hypothetical protein AB8H80_08675 [Planctomycetota bacterium]